MARKLLHTFKLQRTAQKQMCRAEMCAWPAEIAASGGSLCRRLGTCRRVDVEFDDLLNCFLSMEVVMSVPGILFNVGLGLLGANQTETRSSIKQGKQDFEQLLESIQKGDLAAAQQALSGLQQVQAAVQSNLPASATSTADSAAATTAAGPLGTDFAALGSALKSGSLTGAQDAYAKLEQDFQSLRQQSSQYGSLGHAAEVYSVLQQLGATGASESTTGGVNAFVGTMDKINGDVGALKQALQSGNQSLSQDAMTRLLQDLRASSLLGRQQAPAASALLATA